MTRGSRFRRLPLGWAVALALSVAGCFTWRPYVPASPLAQTTRLPYRLRATMADSTLVDLTSPFVRSDSLYGRSGPRRDTVALSVPGVRGLERERLSIWRTLVVTVVAPIAALFTVFAIACGDGECGAQPTQ